MPELPEVQTIVSDLNKKLKGHIFKKIWTDWPKSFQPSFKATAKTVKDQKVKRVRRRAKNILIDLSSGKTVLIHLKMTGQLLYRHQGWKKKIKKSHPFFDPYNQYIRTIFFLDKNKELAFSDLRRFGEICLFDTRKERELKRLKNLGPEPLEKAFDFSNFLKILQGKKRQIKSFLLDQRNIAGIGNIYADEILWQAKIHPRRLTNRLSLKQKRKLFFAIKKILQEAVKNRGTSISDYRDLKGEKGSYQKIRKVYQRNGLPCYRCKTPIQRIKVNNRGTNFCPFCQKN